MTRILSPEELLPTPAEQQADPNIIDLNQTNPDLTGVPEQRTINNDALFTPRIMMLEDTSTEPSRILSISPVTEGAKSVVLQPRIMTLETTDEPAAVAAAEEAPIQQITQVETDAENSATAIPGMATVAKPARSQKERTGRTKASTRKRNRKANADAQQAVAATNEPVAEIKPSKGTKEPQKISMIGGLAMAKMTGGRLAFRKPNVTLPRRNKAVIATEESTEKVEAQTPNKSVKEKLAYNLSPSMLMLRARTRTGQTVSGMLSGEKAVESPNNNATDKERMSKKSKGAIVLGVLAVGAIAYANHKGFDLNPFDGAEAVGDAAADSGKAPAVAEQPQAAQKFENAGVTPKGAGVATAPIGSAEAAEIASTIAEKASEVATEIKGSPVAMVASGEGFTDMIQDSANQLGVELSGQEAYDMYEALETQFGGDIINGDTYKMADGNYGISSPGKTTWNPDAQRFFEDLIEEAKKKKTTS